MHIPFKTIVKECFNASSSCSGNIIHAHSIQNNKILKKISRNGKVLYFSIKEKNGNLNISLEEIGRNKATTFTGFCQYHDNELFKSIELRDYSKTNQEQEFLFAYRALAKEYLSKKKAINMTLEQIKSLNYPETNKEYYSAFLNGQKKSLDELSKLRITFNKILVDKTYNKIYTCAIEFHSEYHIAVSSAFTISYDFNRHKINDFSDFNKDLKFLFLTIFPQNGKTYILLSCLREHKKLFSPLMNKISNKKELISDRKIFLTNLICVYVENFVISPTMWNEKISTKNRSEIEDLFIRTSLMDGYALSNTKNINLFV